MKIVIVEHVANAGIRSMRWGRREHSNIFDDEANGVMAVTGTAYMRDERNYAREKYNRKK